MGDVAILGAGGFVGARAIEMAALAGRSDVAPIVRSLRSVARTANLGLRPRLGDASRADSLGRAIDGCAAVVNLTAGDPGEILPTTRAVYEAAVAAGARVLVHMSSASVFGGIERPDLPDDAAPPLDGWMPYAREKARAERYLADRMTEGRITIVVLRPGLVWGPGSPWVLGPADELVRGAAYLAAKGEGICNLMYVDDLIRSVDAVLERPVGGFYNVGDLRRPTWRAYYGALAAGLGVDPSTIHQIDGDRYRPTARERVDALRQGGTYRWLKARISPETRALLKLRLSRARRTAGGAGASRPSVTRTMWELQRTRYALPTGRFRATFDVRRRTEFDEAMRASLAWLGFIGIAPFPLADEVARATETSGQQSEMVLVDQPVR